MRYKKFIWGTLLIAMVVLSTVPVSQVSAYEIEEKLLDPISGSNVDPTTFEYDGHVLAEGFAADISMDLPVPVKTTTQTRVGFAVAGLGDSWEEVVFDTYYEYTPYVKEMWLKVDGGYGYSVYPGSIFDNTGTGAESMSFFELILLGLDLAFLAYDIYGLLQEVYQDPPDEEWQHNGHWAQAITRQKMTTIGFPFPYPYVDPPRLQTAGANFLSYFDVDGPTTLAIMAEAEIWLQTEMIDPQTGLIVVHDHIGTYSVSFEVEVPVGTYNVSVRTYCGGQMLYDVPFWVDDEMKYSPDTIQVGYGTHSVEVKSPFDQDDYVYAFLQWEDGITDNPRIVDVEDDMMLRAYFVVISSPVPPAQEHQYTVMEGVTTTCGEYLSDIWYWDEPFHTRPPNLTPLLMNRDITFSDPDPEAGVVYLNVPAETYDGLSHIFFDEYWGNYFRHQLFMEWDGYGWLFTGEGTNPISGDVDCYTFSDNTGTYWGPESPKAGESITFGPDGIPGTGDDGFGDGTPDPNGSSILYLPTTLDVDYWGGSDWVDLYDAPWPQVLTTAVAYNIVDEPGSAINGVSSTVVGKPWEFLAGEDHKATEPGYEDVPVPWSHPYSNAYVTYVCTWSVLNYDPNPPGGSLLDIHFKIEERLVREDCVIADIDGNELVDIVDQVICALSYGAKDEGFGYPVADPNFDARGDVSDTRGLVDIVDVVRIAINHGWKLTPDGIIKP